ncbi:RfaG Glycosyltransferase [uncultured Caudovirales phage]|uniref:RfaG Glycosyltransferase n=1 Tax=uncultured Caudovirales phage TaxID=2100421 RepID=A0A6J5NVZ6_9CAUD|nr:RfaG Glycosyltransferase [uncultured Caudovirales phage]
MAFEENEISINSKGGTELSKRSIASFISNDVSKEFQVIASRVRNIEEDKIRIYWQHDLAEDPEVNHLKNASSRDRFHKFVFVSNWQLQEYITKLGFPQDNKTIIIENPIEPLELVPKVQGKVNLIYFSTPHRGLEILVPVFEELAKKYDHIHLNVFSSFKIYGWEEMDKNYEPLYERIRNHPQMTYHGFVEQSVLRSYIQQSHILAYPSIWKETSCRVLIESMSAGLLCVHPNLAALPETSGGLTSMYQFLDNVNDHSSSFYQSLEHAINIANKAETQNYLKYVKAYSDIRFNINKIGTQWEHVMRDLITLYPTQESRKISSTNSNFFVYKV